MLGGLASVIFVLSGCSDDDQDQSAVSPENRSDRAAEMCAPELDAYGEAAELVAAFEDGDDAICWIDGEVSKAPPPPESGEVRPSFDRAVVRVSASGDATLIRAGYRTDMPVEEP